MFLLRKVRGFCGELVLHGSRRDLKFQLHVAAFTELSVKGTTGLMMLGVHRRAVNAAFGIGLYGDHSGDGVWQSSHPQ